MFFNFLGKSQRARRIYLFNVSVFLLKYHQVFLKRIISSTDFACTRDKLENEYHCHGTDSRLCTQSDEDGLVE